MLGNFFYFLLSADFFKKLFLKVLSGNNIIRESNSLDQDQARHLVGHDLGSYCLLKTLVVKELTLCLLGNFLCFFCRQLFFFQNKLFFLKNSFRN